jgi:uncharacterized protein with HEPN domain
MPPRDPRAYLWDVAQAARAIKVFTVGLDANSYAASELVMAAVERKFEIIGEALNQLAKHDPVLANRIPELPHIVAFRNQLIHAYAVVDNNVVWTISQKSLPGLQAAVTLLMDEFGVP